MYSGSTLPAMKSIDTWFGAHQKIDRIARRCLKQADNSADVAFPTSKEILYFEGPNGPDAIKRKTPAQDEPWHYFDPSDESDTKILEIIEEHYQQLVVALRENKRDKSAFEAAWLAHALVDGMTPAHHYPYEEELMRLRGGKGIESRNTAKEKLLMHGDSVSERMLHNWEMWGDKGLLATHIAFEVGIAGIVAPMRFKKQKFDTKKSKAIMPREQRRKYYRQQALTIANMQLYESFYKNAWTPGLMQKVRKTLAPIIISTVATIWYAAYLESRV